MRRVESASILTTANQEGDIQHKLTSAAPPQGRRHRRRPLQVLASWQTVLAALIALLGTTLTVFFSASGSSASNMDWAPRAEIGSNPFMQPEGSVPPIGLVEATLAPRGNGTDGQGRTVAGSTPAQPRACTEEP